MSSQQTIPTPPKRWLRAQFRRWLPPLVFLGVLAIVIAMGRQRMEPDIVSGEVDALHTMVVASVSGLVLEMRARDLQEVAQGEIIAKIMGADQRSIEIPAPIAGRVGFINKRAGETVLFGETIAQITGPKADRIVCYLRQPLSIKVVPGQKVSVRSRALGQQTADAQVIKVSGELLPIRKSLLPPSPDRGEMGLPILVSVPAELGLHPGELVDLSFKEGIATAPAVTSTVTNRPPTNSLPAKPAPANPKPTTKTK